MDRARLALAVFCGFVAGCASEPKQLSLPELQAENSTGGSRLDLRRMWQNDSDEYRCPLDSDTSNVSPTDRADGPGTGMQLVKHYDRIARLKQAFDFAFSR